MHPTERALLDAVIATPDDDLPRLVLADWYEENGRPERAEFIRVRSPLVPRQYFRTRDGRKLLNLVRDQIGGAIPKSWRVWLINDPVFYNRRRTEPESWWAHCGDCSFTCSGVPFVVTLRHGFVDAVAAHQTHLAKVLPAVCRLVPLTRVCVINEWFGDYYDAGHTDPYDGINRSSRVIRQWSNRMPVPVWDGLTAETRVNYMRRPYKLYPDSESLHRDLGTSFLSWARSQPHPAVITSTPVSADVTA